MRGEEVGRGGREGDTATLLPVHHLGYYYGFSVAYTQDHNVKKGFASLMELSLDLLTLLYGSKMRETIMAERTHDGRGCSPHDIQYAERKE